MLTIQHCKESLSRAYITAIVGRSLNNLSWGAEYDYGVDGFIRKLTRRGSRVTQTGFGFDFQAKSTTNWTQEGNEIVSDLEANAYNDLAARSAAPRGLPMLLVILCLDQDDSRWLTTDPDQMILRKCAYWHQITGTFTENENTQRIRIPTSNLFNCSAVTQLLTDVESGALLP